MTTVQQYDAKASSEAVSLTAKGVTKEPKVKLTSIISSVGNFVAACTQIDQKSISAALKVATETTKSSMLGIAAILAVCFLVEGQK